MGSCSTRHYLLSICIVQLLTIIERQVFDFLGYMWAPILVNFFHIIFVIFGIFGTYQLRAKYIVIYAVWTFVWIGWNAFLICFYLNVGILDRDSDILNLGTGSVSWFEVNGYGCNPTFPTNITSEDPYRPVRPERVDGCLLDYPIVEVIHSGVQCLLAVLGLIGALCIGRIFIDEDDDQSNRGSLKSKTKKKHRQSLYSIEFSPPVDAIRSGHESDDILTYHQQTDLRGIMELSPKPMTPRRVKRRSVMTRGSNNRQSTSSRRSHSNNRSSVRNSRRKVHHQNPVTKIIEQQNMRASYPTFNGPSTSSAAAAASAQGETSPLTVTNLQSLNKDYVNPMMSHIASFQQHQHNSSPDPIYYNMNSSSPLMQQSWNSGAVQNQNTPPTVGGGVGGHVNQSYQHSTPNLSHSPEPPEEPYHRPPSVRSSYSNFHGARPLTSYTSTTPSENVFVQLGAGSKQHNQHNQHNHHPHPQKSSSSSHHAHAQQSVPQIPQRRPPASEPISTGRRPAPTVGSAENNSMAFLNNGPPAYNLNYHTPPDSETTM